ncbi:hypothetical protein AX16_003685 [Volvariella volvacea WC 439]|nr:hypothetical protein AX16_003685 [Volvariella volvacea WC 439]
MAHRTQAIQALKLGVAICDTAGASLADHASLTTSQQSGPADLPVLHKDFLSLLTFLHNSTTKLSIALKPSSPTYAAAMTPLKDLAAHVNALTHCAGMFAVHGKAISREAETLAADVIKSIRDLHQTFLDIDSGDASQADKYLVKTGTVHNLIDTARSTSGLSSSNAEAVRKTLAQTQASLDDGLSELQEMLDDTNESDKDDGWDELGLGTPQKLTSAEVERVKKAHMVLRLSTLFHKRIHTNLLSPQNQWNPTTLDKLPSLSAELLTRTDELVSTVYGHNSEEILSEFMSFKTAFTELRDIVQAFFAEAPIDQAMSQLSTNEVSRPVQKGSKQWFDTCIEQIDKSSQALVVALQSNTAT